MGDCQISPPFNCPGSLKAPNSLLSRELTGILIIKMRTLNMYFSPCLIKTNSLQYCNSSPPHLYRCSNGGTARELKTRVLAMRLQLSWTSTQPVPLATRAPCLLLGLKVYTYQLNMTFRTDFPDLVDNKDFLIYKISIISELRDWER